MLACSALPTSAAPARSSVRAWVRDLATRPAPLERGASCRACGLVVKSERSLSHAAALEAETQEKARLAALARDFLNEAEAGATVYASDFLAWLGDDARKVSVEGCRAVLAAALEGYRRVCAPCGGRGGEAHIVGGWGEPITEGHRCGHCDGEGELEPPHLAPLEEATSMAAE